MEITYKHGYGSLDAVVYNVKIPSTNSLSGFLQHTAKFIYTSNCKVSAMSGAGALISYIKQANIRFDTLLNALYKSPHFDKRNCAVYLSVISSEIFEYIQKTSTVISYNKFKMGYMNGYVYHVFVGIDVSTNVAYLQNTLRELKNPINLPADKQLVLDILKKSRVSKANTKLIFDIIK